MLNTMITYFQLLVIGFSFGFAGPCTFHCTPIILGYVAADRANLQTNLKNIIIFLFGRMIAYLILGILAGISGHLIKEILSHHAVFYLKIVGIISMILLAVLIITNKLHTDTCKRHPNITRFGLFSVGFSLGVIPCIPLTMLLVEVALISKHVLDGFLYTLFFALGTSIAGFLVIGILLGILSGILSKFAKNIIEKYYTFVKISYAVLLVIFSVYVFWRK